MLFDAFIASLTIAGIACVLTFVGWLGVQWLANLHYLFGKGGKDDHSSGD